MRPLQVGILATSTRLRLLTCWRLLVISYASMALTESVNPISAMTTIYI